MSYLSNKLSILIMALYLGISVNGVAMVPDHRKVLVIPGGGALGLGSILTLKQLEKDTGKRIYEIFDEIWGASIGALQAALLTTPVLGEREPMTAAQVADFLETEIFAHFHTALGIRGLFREKLGKEPLLGETLVPLRILTAEITEWKAGFWPQKTELRGFSSQEDPHVFLSDVACASATVFPLHPLSERISGIPFESAHDFIDAGCMVSSSCCMDPYDFKHFPRKKEDRFYFVGNGWVNRTFSSESQNYAINVDLTPVLEQWSQTSYVGAVCQKWASRLIKCNLGAAGFIPAEILRQALGTIAESEDYQKMLKSLQ